MWDMRRGYAASLAIVLAAASFCQTGWSRYRVYPATAAEAQRINDSSLGMFSDEVAIGETDVIVAPGQLPELARLRLPARWISSLPDPRKWGETHPSADGDEYQTQYLRYDTIIAKYEEWRTQYPYLITRQQFATSWNGRALWAYKFLRPDGARNPDKSVVVTCGIHAREWITPPLGMYIMDQLIKGFFTRSPFTPRIPPGTAFYFVPVINPDGYEYCWTNNRMWRKNRRNNGGSFGVDLNRNYSKAWGGAGSSGTPSSETYRGPSAFSEPELSGFRDFLGTIPPVKAFVDFHSYGQLILWPWSYTTTTAPGNSWLQSTGNAMKQAISAATGFNYTAGQGSTTLYIASGSSKDYFYDRFDCPSYTIEVRDTGQTGFLLPADQILPTQIENWAAFQELVAHMLDR